MNRKGFTLIELLAVILILAIIALIAIPVVTNIINDAKKGALKDSAYGVIDSADLYFARNVKGVATNLEFICEDNECITGANKLDFKGEVKAGRVKLYNDGRVSICLENGTYAAYKNLTTDKVTVVNGSCNYSGDDYAVDQTVTLKEFNDMKNDYENQIAELKANSGGNTGTALKTSASSLVDSANSYFNTNMQGGSTNVEFICENNQCTSGTNKLNFDGEVKKGRVKILSNGKVGICIEDGLYASYKDTSNNTITIKNGGCNYTKEEYTVDEYNINELVTLKDFNTMKQSYESSLSKAYEKSCDNLGTILWTNPNPTADLNATTLNYTYGELLQYSRIRVIFKMSKTSSTTLTAIVGLNKAGASFGYYDIGLSDGKTSKHRPARYLYFNSDNKLVISNAIATSTSYAENGYLIVTGLYGMK